MDPRFAKPVTVALGSDGNVIHVVRRVAHALDILVNHWPVAHGEKAMVARRVCVSVLNGNAVSFMARSAFVEAAQEAGILVQKPKRPFSN
jgi:hypothetical protein